MKTKLILICLTIFLGFTIVNAQDRAEQSLPKKSKHHSLGTRMMTCDDPFQITAFPSMYNAGDMNGDYIAWGDIFGDIYLYQISTNETTQIVESELMGNTSVSLTNRYLFYGSDDVGINAFNLQSKTNQFIYGDQDHGVRASGDNIAWIELIGSDFEVKYVNVNNLSEVKNVSNSPDRDWILSVYPTALFWQNSSAEWNKLIMYETLTSNSSLIVVDSVVNISGSGISNGVLLNEKLYYTKRIDGVFTLHSYDVQSGARQIIPNEGNYFFYGGSGNNIVLNREGELAIFDLNTSTITPIPNSENNGVVVTNANAVIWEYEPDFAGEIDIFQYNLSTGEITALANSSEESEFIMAVSGTYLVYAKGDMINDHLFIQSLVPLAIELINIEGTSFGLNEGFIDVEITGGTGGLTYAWTGPDGFTADTEDISNLASGTYTLNVTDGNDCAVASENFIVEEISSVDNSTNENEFHIFPNPITNILNFHLKQPMIKNSYMKIYDTNSKLIMSKKIKFNDSNQYSLDCNMLFKGIYILVIETEEGIHSRRFIKM